MIGGITDRLTSWRACYGTARLFGPETTFILANAGRVQSMVNPPGVAKSFFFAAPADVEDPVKWAEAVQATRQEGSWWLHWRAWMQSKSARAAQGNGQARFTQTQAVGRRARHYIHEK